MSRPKVEVPVGTGVKKFVGRTTWSVDGPKGPLQFGHFDSWDPQEDPIDAFPGDVSRSEDRAEAGTILIFNRAEELVRRNVAATKCKFPGNVPLLTTEHCSELQALIAAHLVTTCKGE